MNLLGRQAVTLAADGRREMEKIIQHGDQLRDKKRDL